LTCFNWVKLILKTDLPSNAKYLSLYLSTYMNLNQDMAFPSLKRIEAETSLAHATVLKQLGILVDEGWLAKQPGDRVTSNRYWINIPQKVVAEVGQIGVGQPLTYVNSGGEVGQPLTSNNNIITNTLSKGFKPPSDTEVEEYARSIGFNLDPHTFIDFYQSKGWMVGKTKMKDWRAAVRTWAKREKQNGPVRSNGKRDSRGIETIDARKYLDKGYDFVG
jgi:hypothetical protein